MYVPPEVRAAIAKHPNNIKIEPIEAPNPNLSACFIIRAKAFHADLKNDSVVSAT